MTFCEQMDKFSLASKYIETADIAISGQGGSEKAWKVALYLVKKLGLTVEEATPFFREWSNRCQPPWSDKEIQHKLLDARDKARIQIQQYTPSRNQKLVNNYKIEAEYRYCLPDGSLLFTKKRYSTPTKKKNFLIEPKGAVTKYPVLYRLQDIEYARRTGDPILLVEGEKDADTAKNYGIIATTDPTGACGWKRIYAEQLRGCNVAIIPDRDAPGYTAAVMRCFSLFNVAQSVKIIELEGNGKDLTDWILENNIVYPDQIINQIIADTPDFDPALLEMFCQRTLKKTVKEITQERFGDGSNLEEWEKKKHLTPVSFLDIKDEPIQEPEYLINGLIARGDLAIFAGQSKAGKSTSLINIAHAISTGGKFVGRQCKRSKVLYISLEDKDYTFKNRIKQLVIRTNQSPENYFFFLSRSQILEASGDISNFELIRNTLIYNKNNSERYNPCERFEVVIIDPFYEMGKSIDENNSKEMGNFIRSIRTLALETEITMILSSHSKKGSLENVEAVEATSGSSFVGRVGEVYFSLAQHEKEDHIICRYKMRDGKTPADEVWRIDYPFLELAEGEDPRAYKRTNQGGRPERWKEEDILNILAAHDGCLETKEIIAECKEIGMGKTVIYRFLNTLKSKNKLRYNNYIKTYSIVE